MTRYIVLFFLALFVFSGSASAKNVCIPYVKIWLDNKNKIHRNNIANARKWSLTWVIKRNGRVVLQRNAANEISYKYFGNSAGYYTVYLKGFVNGRYQVFSNVVNYNISGGDRLPRVRPR